VQPKPRQNAEKPRFFKALFELIFTGSILKTQKISHKELITKPREMQYVIL
jgi:hypothetical protein